MIKVGDRVFHLKSQVVGTVVEANSDHNEYSVLVHFDTFCELHDKAAYYDPDGKVWTEDDTATIVPCTKLHKLLYGIED